MTKHPKILLIAPHSTQHRKTAILIPIGLLSIAGYLKKCGYEVKVYNASFVPKGSSKDRMGNVKKVLKDYSPDIIGLGFPSDAFEPAIEIAKFAKDFNKEIIVIAGGIHPTAMPKQTVEVPYFDFLVHGEGEITTFELVNTIVSEKSFHDIKGISYKKNSQIITTEPRPEIINLDEIPFDNRDLLIDVEKYPKQALGQIHTSRGCIYHCAYCSAHIVWKNNIRFRSVENVLGEIDYLYLKYRVRDFNFADDNFTSNTERLQTICHEIIKRKYKIGWRCCARSDISRNLNSQDLKLMYNAGCRTMCIGFESGAQSLLDGINRNITVSDMEKTIKMVKDAGIELHADFIMGLPGENEATLAETGKLMKKLWDNYRPTMTVVLYKPYPGTPLWKHNPIRASENLMQDDGCPIRAIRSHLSDTELRLFPKFKELFDYAEKCNIKKLSGNLGYVSGRLLESITSPKDVLLLFKKVIRRL